MSTLRIDRFQVYWWAWLILVGVVFVLRFTVFSGAGEPSLVRLALVYGIGSWLPVMALNLVEGRRLSSYMRSCHAQHWDRLNYIPLFGCVGHNGFRVIPWLYSTEDFGDPVVAALKADYRRFIRWAVTVFFSHVIVIPVLLGVSS